MTRYLKQYKFLLFLTVLFTAISSLSYVFIAILLQQVMDIVDIGDMDGFIRIMLFSLAYRRSFIRMSICSMKVFSIIFACMKITAKKNYSLLYLIVGYQVLSSKYQMALNITSEKMALIFPVDRSKELP